MSLDRHFVRGNSVGSYTLMCMSSIHSVRQKCSLCTTLFSLWKMGWDPCCETEWGEKSPPSRRLTLLCVCVCVGLCCPGTDCEAAMIKFRNWWAYSARSVHITMCSFRKKIALKDKIPNRTFLPFPQQPYVHSSEADILYCWRVSYKKALFLRNVAVITLTSCPPAQSVLWRGDMGPQ